MKKYFLIFLLIFVVGIGAVVYRPYVPKVSVVMLTYKRGDIVSKAIESVLAQTYKDFEFIIINDGSLDNTDEVVKKYKKNDKRIRYYKNPKNMGIAFSRNRAFGLARAPYIMIMDDDDFSLNERMEKQVKFLDKNPQIDVVVGQIKGFPRVPQNHNAIASFLIQHNVVGNANIMYRSDFAKEHKIFYDEELKISEDWDYWVKMLFSGAKFASIEDDVLVREPLSVKHHVKDFEEGNKVIRKKIGEYFSPDNFEKFYDADACEKVKMIVKKSVFTEDFEEHLLQSNCKQN
jgi:glycosyltransferase involved in cell wall biosynthesis